jgi:hypothetical protein
MAPKLAKTLDAEGLILESFRKIVRLTKADYSFTDEVDFVFVHAIVKAKQFPVTNNKERRLISLAELAGIPDIQFADDLVRSGIAKVLAERKQINE